MPWQDLALSIGSFIFTVALIPSLRSKHKPALSTSVLTGIILLVFAAVYLSLTLWLGAALVLLNAVTWFILAAQKYQQE